MDRPALFDPDRRWVPGDAEVASFHVRNSGPTTAQLTIEVSMELEGSDKPVCVAESITRRY